MTEVQNNMCDMKETNEWNEGTLSGKEFELYLQNGEIYMWSIRVHLFFFFIK